MNTINVLKRIVFLNLFCSWNKSFVGLVAISASSSSTSVIPSLPNMPQIQNIVRNISNTTASKVSVDKSKRILEAKRIIQSADIVCFDVDSTVICEEGIDELANFCGKGEEVSNLTKEAMGGSMTFQEALRRRLDIIKPTSEQIRQFLLARPSTLSSHVK